MIRKSLVTIALVTPLACGQSQQEQTPAATSAQEADEDGQYRMSTDVPQDSAIIVRMPMDEEGNPIEEQAEFRLAATKNLNDANVAQEFASATRVEMTDELDTSVDQWWGWRRRHRWFGGRFFRGGIGLGYRHWNLGVYGGGFGWNRFGFGGLYGGGFGGGFAYGCYW